MQENDLYYAPSIEEFHVGFRYFEEVEEEDTSPLVKKILEFECDWIEFSNNFNTEKLVKYLDIQDIEELGFIFYKCREAETLYAHSSGRFYLETSFGSHVIKITTNAGYQLFHGTIKNYNELQTLLKQLNIS